MQQQKFSSEKYLQQNGRKLPIEKCLIADLYYQNHGLTICLLIRKQPSGYFSFANFLVDRCLLGVKATIVNCNFPMHEIDALLEKASQHGKLEEVSPVYFHNMVYGAVDYAAENGFQPCKDFAHAQYLLNPDLVDDGIDDIEFGWEGKPFYIQGPFDDGKRILSILKAKVGEGNYHFIAEGNMFND